MELLTPGYGLLLFQLIILMAILLLAISWVIILLNNRLESGKKIVWLIGTGLLPLIGPILFFISYKNLNKKF
ncbi:MAG: PLDc N-terminal domain-containing protein [Cyclobacteriaceae bacterium]